MNYQLSIERHVYCICANPSSLVLIGNDLIVVTGSADLHRTSSAVLDMKDDRYPIRDLDKGVSIL